MGPRTCFTWINIWLNDKPIVVHGLDNLPLTYVRRHLRRPCYRRIVVFTDCLSFLTPTVTRTRQSPAPFIAYQFERLFFTLWNTKNTVHCLMSSSAAIKSRSDRVLRAIDSCISLKMTRYRSQKYRPLCIFIGCCNDSISIWPSIRGRHLFFTLLRVLSQHTAQCKITSFVLLSAWWGTGFISSYRSKPHILREASSPERFMFIFL